MNYYKRLVASLNSLIDVPVSDPDDARRRKFLNIILITAAIIASITALITLSLLSFGVSSDPGVQLVILASGITLAGSLIIYSINRFFSGKLASILFLILLMGTLSLADTPQELSTGRSLFLFVLPIIISSVLIGPKASFIFYALVSMELMFLANLSGQPTNIPAITSFLLLTLVSWLSSRSLENALKEVRTINAELDQRVAERTQALSEALTREQAEASRRQAILQSIADGVIVFDINGDAILVNPAITHMLQIPFDGILGYAFDNIFQPPQISDEDRHLLARTMQDLDSTLVPIRIRWNDKTLSVNAAPVRNTHGQSIGKVAVLRDFTHEAEVEQMKNHFVAMVSHELRTPLNAILGYSEMLREAFYGPMNDKQTNAADRILNNSRRLLDIVSDLLDQAQIEAGRLTFHISEFNTRELAENLHSVMDKIANDKGLELKSEIATDMPETLRGDTHRLQQVLVNLVNNAVKFTETGSVSVHIFRVSGQNWGFDVVDTGPGIAPENQQDIFDPFRQVDGTSTRVHGGIGLGLAIVQKLVDRMGGRIFVQSVLGKGSVFTVILPYQPPEQKEQL